MRMVDFFYIEKENNSEIVNIIILFNMKNSLTTKIALHRLFQRTTHQNRND